MQATSEATVAINPDIRPPLRVRFSALGSIWVREFWDFGEALRFANGKRCGSSVARVERRS